MKSLTKMTMAAAALMVVAGSASAQVLKAEVPFSFTAAGTRLQAGTYQISSRGLVVRVANTAKSNNSGTMAITTAGPEAPNAWRAGHAAMLSFECRAGQCELHRIWFGDSPRTAMIPVSRHAHDDHAAVEVINVAATRAD